MPENRDLKASKGIPKANQIVSEINVNNKNIITHSDIEKKQNK